MLHGLPVELGHVVELPWLLERITNDLKRMDQPRQQILLEARVVELTKGYGRLLGTDTWLWSDDRTQISWDTVQGSLDFLRIKPDSNTDAFTRTLLARLSLLVENKWASIVASPRVIAQEGAAALIKVVTEEYFLITTEGYYYRSELEQIESGIVLEVTPRLGEDGDITLLVKPEVSNVVGLGTDDLPVITRRQVQTTVRVRDGGTAVIAGLVSNFSSETRRRMPILGSIPLLGWLFRGESKEEVERQITVFITPHIIDQEGGGVLEKRRHGPVPEPVGKEFTELLRQALDRRGQEIASS